MSAPGSVDSEVLAAIGAAVALALQKPHRILSVQQLVIPQDATLFVLNPWSMEGRFQIFRSHQIR